MADSMAKQSGSQFLRVSLSGPGDTLIDRTAGASTACLAACPRSAQHSSRTGQAAVLCAGAVTVEYCVVRGKHKEKQNANRCGGFMINVKLLCFLVKDYKQKTCFTNESYQMFKFQI